MWNKFHCVFFEKNGYSAAHWEKGTIAVGMELARIKNKPLLTYCKEYDIYRSGKSEYVAFTKA